MLEARAVLGETLRRIADELRNSIEFHRRQQGDTRVAQAVLTGPVASIPGFAEQLGAEIGLPLELGVAVEATPGALGGVDPGRAALAAGLALAEVSR